MSFAAASGIIVFVGAVAYAAVSDVASRTIPNWLVVVLLAAYAALAPLAGFGLAEMQSGVVAGLLVLAGSFTLFSCGWIGGGDAKLASVSSLWLGAAHTPSYLLSVALVGGVLTVGFVLLRTRAPARVAGHPAWLAAVGRSGSGVPYGVALATGALIVLPSSHWVAV